MNTLVHILAKSGLLTKDLDYHLIRASMVLIFLAFGYQKWFAYEAQVLIPYISNGPLIFWLYPVFGIRGASWPKRSTKTSIKLLVVIPTLGSKLTFQVLAGSTSIRRRVLWETRTSSASRPWSTRATQFLCKGHGMEARRITSPCK